MMMDARTTECGLCSEEIEDGEDSESMPFVSADSTVEVKNVHRDCVVRSVLGGIGHHEDHDYWCGHMHDPDGGRSLRQSAREVCALLRERGVEGMV
jgi:hypothetical protein